MEAYPLSFENTENAFAYKPGGELKKAAFLFRSMSYQTLVKLGTRITPWVIRLGLPVRGLIRNTLFDQFVGGETLAETARVADKLEKFGVNVILDYGVEGKEGEKNFEHSCEEFINVVKYATGQRNIPFISIKVTGFARFALLEKLDAAANDKSGYSGNVHIEVLNDDEKKEWDRVVERMERIIGTAAAGNVSVLVDAEESWIQDPVDAITMKMMQRHNTHRAVVYNTIQLYRSDRLQFLQNSIATAESAGFILGAKLVRGAYMEKERKRAAEHKYASPIQPNKNSTDRDYNLSVKMCIDKIQSVATIVASHNENSNLYTTQLMNEKNVERHHPHIHFSQLYGMSDHITFNLAKAGYSVSKYLPFGPIKDVIPYLMRRAHENSSVAGQTGRELSLIKKELKRREQTRTDKKGINI
jgi:proline dehydrogenase